MDSRQEAEQMEADILDGYWGSAGFIQAALEVSWYETGDNPSAYPLNPLDGVAGTTGNAAADALRRLAKEIQEYRETVGKWHDRQRRKEGR